jgi:hypothetical protein
MNAFFPPTSRYALVETTTIEDANGVVTIYLRRRFMPPPERFAQIGEHIVTQGERLDTITAQHLDDPEQYWRICDANRAMRPDDLTAPPIGRRLRITLPEGIAGPPNG